MINNIVLMGRLVADPELRTTTGGKSVTQFKLAVDRSYDRNIADFIPVVAWGKTAEFVANYFSKGSMIAVQGSLQSRNYEDKNGNKRTAYEVTAAEVSFCGDKAKTSTPEPEEPDDFPFE